MTVSLAVNGITFTFADDEIDFVSSETSQSPDQVPIIGTGAMGAYAYNYNGVTKTIRVGGSLRDLPITTIGSYSINTKIEQKQWLESVFNGQTDKITFVSDYESTTPYTRSGATAPYQSAFTYTKVVAGSITFRQETFNVGNDNLLPFSITLVVGQ